MNELEKYKEDYNRLKEYGNALQFGFIYDYKKHPKFKKFFNELDDEKKNTAEKYNFSKCYNAWYNESLRLIKQLLPERYDDFVSFYSAEKKRKDIDITNYTISDALVGLQITRNSRVVIEPADALKLFQQQLNILISLDNCFESSLFNIRELLQADIFDSELDGAKELHKNGFYRAAGALCGVILEKHFAGVCVSHAIKMKKAAPGVSDYNEKLKDEAVVDNKTYLLIQRLGTIRNLCDHNKKQEPTKEDIEDLINGTYKILHEVL
jgi:hypothetical protein